MQPLLSYSIQIAKQAAHGHVAAGDGLARAVRPADDKREVVVHRLGKAGADILAAHDAHRLDEANLFLERFKKAL